jgi:hypothetical protein
MNSRIAAKIADAKHQHKLFACIKCNKKTVECINKSAPKFSNERYVRKCFNQSCDLYGKEQMLSAAASNKLITKLPPHILNKAIENDLNRQLKYSPAKEKSIAHVTNEEKQRVYNEIAELFNI